jgi:hypothetical protein
MITLNIDNDSNATLNRKIINLVIRIRTRIIFTFRGNEEYNLQNYIIL